MTAPTLPALGIILPQFTSDPGGTLRALDDAHRLGYAGAFAVDHLWPLGGGRSRPILECWTLLGALAGRVGTLPHPPERPPLRLGTLVTRAGLRSGALLAHMAATIAQAAGAPPIVGIGGGDRLTLDEHHAFGLPWSADQRVAAVTQAVDALRRLPPGAAQRPQVWVGGAGARMRALAGRAADGWNVWAATPAELAAGRAEVQRAAAAAGRDPAEIAVTWGGQVLVAPTAAEAARRLDRWRVGRAEADVGRTVAGDPDTVAAHLADLRAAGAAWCVVIPVGGDRAAACERLARATGLTPRPSGPRQVRRPVRKPARSRHMITDS